MSIPTSKWFSSLMCQRGVGSERHLKPFSLSFVHILYEEGVNGQCAQMISILRCVVAIGDGFSRLGVLSRGPPFSFFDMFFVLKRGLGI
jgi:hypothetical protein